MKYFILTLLLVGLTVAGASAQVTSTFTQVDPGTTLEGYVSNTWDVSTGPQGWLSAVLRVQLTSGDIYQDAAGSDAPPNPLNFGTFPTLEYDSYMTGGTDSEAPSTTGLVPTVVGGAVDLGGGIAATFDTEAIDATWGSSEATNPWGELMLGRFTLSDSAQGIYSYRIGVSGSAPTSLVGGYVVNGAMTAPVLTSTFNQVDPGATLEGYVSNTWNVNTLGEEWLSAVLLVELTSGSVYQDAAGGDAPPNPLNFGAFPTLEYDSYMTGGTDSEAPSTTGLVPTVVGGAVDLGGGIPLTFDTSGVDATWGSSEVTNPSGELMLGRVTLSDNAQGTYKFRIGLDDSGAVFYLGGVIVDGAMVLTGSVPAPAIPGDANGDGSVNETDAQALADNWGASSATWSMGDFDGDGVVGPTDGSILAANWGTAGESAGTVPEPSASVLLVMAAVLASLVRRRGR